MFLRANIRTKNGKSHRYFTVVESQRLASGRTQQRQVLYLGELNDAQHAGWVRAIEAFEGRDKQPRQLALFPDDRDTLPALDCEAVRIRIDKIELHRPRQWGGCFLALWLWESSPARRVLARAPAAKPQGHAVAQCAEDACRLPPAGAGQRVAAAPPVV